MEAKDSKAKKRRGNFTDEEWKELKRLDAAQKRRDRKLIKENETEEQKQIRRHNEKLRKRLQRERKKMQENRKPKSLQPGRLNIRKIIP